jgi:iron complex outermembrane receptor protein
MGSFNTWKNTFQLGTGLIKEKWAFEGRASSITTDGYVDRAFSNLKSFFLQGGYFGHSTLLKAVVFGGKEKTYQAWYGVDRETMENDPTFNWAGAIYDKEWNIAAFYDNETDNYQQDHYQLHLSQIINSSWRFNCSLHYTYGRGYYEQYYSNEYLGDYPIGVQYFGYDSLATGDGYNYFYHDTISTGDLIVRRWLDNHFYGTTFALYYDAPGLKFTFGGAYNQYANAKHFGEIIWAEYAGDTQLGDKFYDNTSDKTDANFYSKIGYPMFNMLNFYIDLQTRYINYKGKGIDKGNQIISIDEAYWFFNPKAGLSLHVGSFGTIYSSYAIAHREPIRTDFLDAPEGIVPKPERLQDIEAGIRKQGKTYSYSMNGYFMLYTNQLVLTGEINDVGEPIRKNIGKSHRLGIEAEGAVTMTRFFKLRANIAYSLNRTDFRQVEDGEIVEYSNTPLTFSPPLISGFELVFIPFGTFEITFTGKYVDRQYLDLTGNKYKSLDPYFINNLRIAWLIREESLGECGLSFQINNLSNRHYASNGYVWDNVPYFYPQAGIQLIGGVNLRF